jgi:hypothetical protein
MQITVSGGGLNKGEKFTIDGCGLSARGHDVMFGKSVKTGRKMLVKTPHIYVAGREIIFGDNAGNQPQTLRTKKA